KSNYSGMPQSVLEEVVVLPFNDLGRTREILERNKGNLAAVLIDLMPSRPGLIPLSDAYVKLLNEYCVANNTLLISDEVLNFRLHYNGAAHRFGLKPDITTLGKIIGGGFPIGAVGGRDEIMAVFDNTEGALVPQGGTFSANPVSMVAGQVSMMHMDEGEYDRLEKLGDYAREKINETAALNRVPFSVTGLASLLRIHPKGKSPGTYVEFAQSADQKQAMATLYDELVARGILISNTGLLALSTPMTATDIDHLVEQLDKIFSNWKTD
ncbi:MAG: aminotransferase class III-fold pyridoxal phosphate-dependent enzyme, partial [Pseudomonadota bacterium]